jgi:hypothetical protein
MHFSHWPLLGFFCLVFVGICTILAIACFFLFRSGAKGTTKLGAPAGCLVAAALLGLALMSGLALLIVLAVHAKDTLGRHGARADFDFEPFEEPEPPQRADTKESEEQPETEMPAAAAEAAAEGRARLRIEFRSDRGWPDLSEDLSGWLRQRVQGEIGLRIETRTTDSGPATELIFDVAIPDQGLDELRSDLRAALPNLRHPPGVEATLEDD